ncbi:hypothetical protein MBR_09282, partial [Metarhizium brunneum ARSEF 3297]
MKVFGFLTALLATARALAAISPEEKQEWESCTDDLIYAYNHGAARVEKPCVFWECLDTNTNKYPRGGGITAPPTLSAALALPLSSG